MRITRGNTTAVIIDVQERLLPHIHQWEETQQRIATLIQGLEVLGVGMVVTEQYPKGLGSTVPGVMEAFSSPPVPIIKDAFSCCDDARFSEALRSAGKKVVLVAGIEAHVCILQTSLDLLAADFFPVVVMDAVSSRNARDRDVAAQRILREGGRITTVESILLELTRFSGTDEFRRISRLIK